MNTCIIYICAYIYSTCIYIFLHTYVHVRRACASGVRRRATSGDSAARCRALRGAGTYYYMHYYPQTLVHVTIMITRMMTHACALRS